MPRANETGRSFEAIAAQFERLGSSTVLCAGDVETVMREVARLQKLVRDGETEREAMLEQLETQRLGLLGHSYERANLVEQIGQLRQQLGRK